MEKFRSKTHGGGARKLPFSYFSTLLYLNFDAFIFERNQEQIIVTQDIVYPHDFPALFFPRKKKNWERATVMFATEDDIKKLHEAKIPLIIQNPIGEEFFYRTDDLQHPKKKFGQRVRQFQKQYSFRVLHSYPQKKIEVFYQEWKKQKRRDGLTFNEGEDFFFFCLHHLRAYDIQQIYVEVDKHLVGLAWGVEHQKGWVGLHLKADYAYKGLSRFLHHERAKLFPSGTLVTLGTGASEPGIASYKKELEPAFTVPYFYVATKEKML